MIEKLFGLFIELKRVAVRHEFDILPLTVLSLLKKSCFVIKGSKLSSLKAQEMSGEFL